MVRIPRREFLSSRPRSNRLRRPPQHNSLLPPWPLTVNRHDRRRRLRLQPIGSAVRSNAPAFVDRGFTVAIVVRAVARCVNPQSSAVFVTSEVVTTRRVERGARDAVGLCLERS